jgi:hypothetical protein
MRRKHRIAEHLYCRHLMQPFTWMSSHFTHHLMAGLKPTHVHANILTKHLLGWRWINSHHHIHYVWWNPNTRHVHRHATVHKSIISIHGDSTVICKVWTISNCIRTTREKITAKWFLLKWLRCYRGPTSHIRAMPDMEMPQRRICLYSYQTDTGENNRYDTEQCRNTGNNSIS